MVVFMPGDTTSIALGENGRLSRNFVVVAPAHEHIQIGVVECAQKERSSWIVHATALGRPHPCICMLAPQKSQGPFPSAW